MNSLVILAGGFGTRLESVSEGKPKALIPIGDLVYLDLLLEKIFKYEISHIYLSLYYKADLFQEYVNKSNYKNKLSCIIEPEPLGTGGAINYVIENSKISSSFFVINGDSLSDINLNRMFEKFEKSQYKAMIGISKVKEVERYGTVDIKNGYVISFNEKGMHGRGFINNGYYVFRNEAFEGCNRVFSLEKEFFPNLVRNCELGVFEVENDSFIDMGIPSDYEKLKERVLKI